MASFARLEVLDDEADMQDAASGAGVLPIYDQSP